MLVFLYYVSNFRSITEGFPYAHPMPDLAARRRVLTRSIPICLMAIVLLLPIASGHIFERHEWDLSFARRGRMHGRSDLHPSRGVVRAQPVSRERVDISAYRGFGTWIDIYNHWPWDHPEKAVKILRRKGVKTIFLQTSNYGAKKAIFRRGQTARFLRAAHDRNMKVVAWYVPSFARWKFDRSRSRAAIRFRTKGGHRFDSFGMDIEATSVGNIALRNKRMIGLSKAVRRFAGEDYPLGAITPDPVASLYWPRFPYERVRRIYDVFVPMGYFSFRARGYKKVKHYTTEGIRVIRRETRDRKVPIHFIGGIAGETDGKEAKAFVHAVQQHDAIGGSYYDFVITTPEEWSELRVLAGRSAPDRNREDERSDPKDNPDKDKKKKDEKDKKGKREDRSGKGKRDRWDKKGKKHGKMRNAERDGTDDDEEYDFETSPRPPS